MVQLLTMASSQWIQFDASTVELENLLFADYYRFEHIGTGTRGIASKEYYIPAHVQEYIDYITPGVHLREDPGRARQMERRQVGVRPFDGYTARSLPTFNISTCDKKITNQCIRGKFVRSKP